MNIKEELQELRELLEASGFWFGFLLLLIPVVAGLLSNSGTVLISNQQMLSLGFGSSAAGCVLFGKFLNSSWQRAVLYCCTSLFFGLWFGSSAVSWADLNLG